MTVGSDVTVRIGVLGSLVVRVGSEQVPIRGERKHRLLARLALTPTRSVSVDSLIAAVWGDEVPRTAKQSLHVHISHIRDQLRPFDAEHLIVTTRNGEYQLGIETEHVDAHLFERLAEAGIVAQHAGNPRRARETLTEAMALFDDPYQPLAEHPGAIAERQRLTAMHETGTEALCDALMDLDDNASAIALLRQVVADEPLRERPYAQLMTAYLAEGDSAAAHAMLDRATEIFEEALGIKPSAELRELFNTFATTRARPERPKSACRRNVEVELLASRLIVVEPDADLTMLRQDVVRSAGHQERRVAWGSASAAGDLSAWHPLIELTDAGDELVRSSESETTRALHRRLTDALVGRYSAGFVLVIESIEEVPSAVADYLSLELTKPGPAPFTLLGISSDPDRVPAALVTVLGPGLAVELPDTAVAEHLATATDTIERQVLEVMLCAFLPAPPDLIARSCEASLVEASTAIERLVSRRVLTVEPGGRLSLSSAAATQSYLHLGDDVQRATHLRLAEHVVSSEGEHGYQVVAEARHRFRAQPDGSLASAIAAGTAAVTHLSRAGLHRGIVDLVPEHLDPGDWPATPEALALRTSIAASLMRTGQVERATSMLEAVADETRASDRPDLFGEAVRWLADSRAPQSSSDHIQLLVAEAVAAYGPDDVSDTRIQLHTDHANSFYFTDPKRAEKLAGEALELGRIAGGATLARAMTGYIQAKMWPHNAEERLALALGAQQQARQVDSTESLVLALTYEASALMELGELRRARPPLRYAEALAYESRVPRFQWWVAAWHALLDFAEGQVDGAESRFREAFEVWPSSARNDAFECLAMQTSTIHLFEERGPELIPLMEAMKLTHGLSVHVALAVAHGQAGDRDAALDVLDDIFRPDQLPACQDMRLGYLLALTAEAAFLADATERADQLMALVEPLADGHAVLNVWGGGGFYWGSLRHALGQALALAGDRDGAVHELRRAATDQLAAGAPLFAQRSQDLADRLLQAPER